MSIEISINNFISDVLAAADASIEAFIRNAFYNLVSANIDTFTTMLVLFVMFIGIRGVYQGFSMEDLYKPILKMIIIYALATNWYYFHKYIYEFFTVMPTYIIASMDGGTAADGLNMVFSRGFKAGNDILAKGGLYSIPSLFWGMVLHIINFGTMIAALGMILLAKFICAIYLFLGPLFIMFALFDTTRSFVENWLQQLVTAALVPVLTCGVLLLTLTISDVILANLEASLAATQGILTHVAEFVGFQALSIYLLRQVPSKAAGLAGGLALSGFNAAVQSVKEFSGNSHNFASSVKSGGAKAMANLSKGASSTKAAAMGVAAKVWKANTGGAARQLTNKAFS